jgi:antitoxin (DNA-binding transcriptional repressor) of toxin-antitoxin stability system
VHWRESPKISCRPVCELVTELATERGYFLRLSISFVEKSADRVFASVEQMCHNVHMKTISIRELHLKTGQWVRHAASRGAIVVTDRGRRVAALQPFDASVTGRPLPNREAAIRKRSKVPVDSAVYQSELREDR